MATGTVKFCNVKKGFGFIKRDNGGPDVYFNIRSRDNRYVPKPGEQVSFNIKEGEKGPYAINLTPTSYDWRFINPYNFVKPDNVAEKDEPISHHQFADPNCGKTLHSGRIFCNLQVQTPIFIPDPEKTIYKKKVEPSSLPEDWEWENDSMEVLFKETEDGSVEVLCKWPERETEKAELSIEDLEQIKSEESKGRGTLHKGTGRQEYYLKTELPLKKGHKVMNFFRLNDEPVVPPTSLKGMIRSIAEALSNSCFSQFDTKRLCHRQVRWGGRATPAIVLSKPEGNRHGKIGLLDNDNKNERYHAWIPAYQRNKLISTSCKTGDTVFVTIKEKKHPRGDWSYYKVVDRKDNIRQLQGANSQKYQGILKITGYNVDGKHDERVFFSKKYQTNLGDKYLQFCQNPDNWTTYLGGLEQRDFNLENQKDYDELIEEQNERRKLAQEPGVGGRKIEATRLQHDKLSVGDLVYAYFDDNQNLIGLFPVLVPLFWDQNSPYDLLPDSLKTCDDLSNLCHCCRLFGMVSGDEQGQALAGKVAFTIARWANDGAPVYSCNTKTLQILSTPHPTCEQFYLIDEPNNERVARYDDRFEQSGGRSERGVRVGNIRGRKFYFHHQQIKDKYAYTDDTNWMNSTVELLKEGTFTFTVDFHNLTDYELGLLLYSLELEGEDSNLCHKLGMGKPLGLGSVKITIDKLELIDRRERYSSILGDGMLKEENYRDRFILRGFKKVQAGVQSDDKETIEQAFNNLPYIKDLKVMLAFKDFHGLEIKYPRARSKRDGEPYGFEWFQQNKDKPLPTAQEVDSNSKILDGWS